MSKRTSNESTRHSSSPYSRVPDEAELESFIKEPDPASASKSSEWHRNRCSLILLLILVPFTLYGIFHTLRDLSRFFSLVQGIKEDIRAFSQLKPVTFQPDDSFLGTGAHVARAWGELFPAGGGFIKVTPSNLTTQRPPMILNGTEFYCISAFHQLHCLQMMQQAWLSPSTTEIDSSPDDDSSLYRKQRHISHCYDYLRQAIMCAADTSLEGRREDFPWDTSEADGWGTMHQCRNWGTLVEYAEENGI